MTFSPRRLAHVNLYVADLEASAAFYRDVCGIEVVFAEPGIEAIFLSNGNSHHDIALMQASEREHVGRDGEVQVSAVRGRFPGLNHLAFEVESEAELVAAMERAVAAGASIDRTLDHQISRSAYISDPDGNVIECYADSVHDWRAAYRDLADELITCQWQPDAATASATSHYEVTPTYTSVGEAPITVRRTARAALTVRDLDRSVTFYRDVIGLSVLRLSTAERSAILGGTLGLPDLLLIEAGDGERAGLHHIGLEALDAVALDEARTRLAEHGIPVTAAVERPDSTAIVVVDPDGLSVEVFVAGEPLDESIVLAGLDRAYVI